MLALMTVPPLLPWLQRQHPSAAQRERELEAIFRGEQVAGAIQPVLLAQQGRLGRGDDALPNSIEQLLEGLPREQRRFKYSGHRRA